MKRAHYLSCAAWRVSSYCGQNGACVEVACNIPSFVAVRDSKPRGGRLLTIDPEQWRGFPDPGEGRAVRPALAKVGCPMLAMCYPGKA